MCVQDYSTMINHISNKKHVPISVPNKDFKKLKLPLDELLYEDSNDIKSFSVLWIGKKLLRF